MAQNVRQRSPDAIGGDGDRAVAAIDLQGVDAVTAPASRRRRFQMIRSLPALAEG
jgi:hypothetical protein